MVAGRVVAAELTPGVHRLELPGPMLGLPAPPSYTEITLSKARDAWSVRAMAGRPQADGIAAWLGALGARDTQFVGGRVPVVKARLPQLPAPLAYVAQHAAIERIGLGRDASAFIVLRAARPRFSEVVAHLEGQRMPENAVPELTARQAEILAFCKEKGYYDVPRRITLRELAPDLGISPPALSNTLRRAEARILSAYVERLRHSLPARKPRSKRRT